jgi:hypothetical protein
MNVAEYLAQKVNDCSNVETGVLRDRTAKYLGSDYEGSWRVMGVPVKTTQKNGTVKTDMQLFYVDGAVIDAKTGAISFDGTETVDPIVSDIIDYAETNDDLFRADLVEFLDGKISDSILKYNIDKADCDDEFAIVTVYILANGVVSPHAYFVYRYNGGAFSFHSYGA